MIRFPSLHHVAWGALQQCNDRWIQPCLQSNLAIKIGVVVRSILESRVGSFGAVCWKQKTAILAVGSTLSLGVVWVLYRRAQTKEAEAERHGRTQRETFLILWEMLGQRQDLIRDRAPEDEMSRLDALLLHFERLISEGVQKAGVSDENSTRYTADSTTTLMSAFLEAEEGLSTLEQRVQFQDALNSCQESVHLRESYVMLCEDLLNESQRRFEDVFGKDPSPVMGQHIDESRLEFEKLRERIGSLKKAIAEAYRQIQEFYSEGPRGDDDEGGSVVLSQPEEETEEIGAMTSIRALHWQIQGMFGHSALEEDNVTSELFECVRAMDRQVNRLVGEFDLTPEGKQRYAALAESFNTTRKQLDDVLWLVDIIARLNTLVQRPPRSAREARVELSPERIEQIRETLRAYSAEPSPASITTEAEIPRLEDELQRIFHQLYPGAQDLSSQTPEVADGVIDQSSSLSPRPFPYAEEVSPEPSLRPDVPPFSPTTQSRYEELYQVAMDLLDALKRKREALRAFSNNHPSP